MTADDQRERRAAFGAALTAALTQAGETHEGLARKIGVAQQSVSPWARGESEPRPLRVLAMERALHVAPGSLAIHLGFGPPIDAPPPPAPTVEEAIAADPKLSPTLRAALLAVYRELVGE
jgi:transcriptional regulator with XRE-family HTH domain